MRDEFESCTNCIHSGDSEPICILRLCKHAIAETKECYESKAQSSFPQRHENDHVAEVDKMDCISRKVAIDALLHNQEVYSNNFGNDPIDKYTIAIIDNDAQTIAQLPSAQPEQRWIPVSERLPKQGQEVICQCRASIIKILKLDANGDWYQDANHCYMGGFVIAWMPLPEPYREEGEAE